MAGQIEETGFRLHIGGRVQGIGFRPYVWRLARSLDLRGMVRNIPTGVEVELRCSALELALFRKRLLRELPPQAVVETLTVTPFMPADEPGPQSMFCIRPSGSGEGVTVVLPDLATCADCRAELFNPLSRYYRYPFISCTHCGPRFSIMAETPYDRAGTSMAAFGMCEVCRREYLDPEDRRFHAQGQACAACGPSLWLETPDGSSLQVNDPFEQMGEQLRAGRILALKGLGGFHLCCNALDEAAVQRLRRCKGRPDKALAVMFTDLEQLRAYVSISPEERNWLTSPQAPILLLRPHRNGRRLAPGIAPDSPWLGCMLPYTPIHHLLMSVMTGPLVMTSGNRSGQPQVFDNQEAREQLADMADLLVMHDRDILQPIDDSVARVQQGSGYREVVRPGRGLAPLALPLPPGFDPAAQGLALGGDLKNTFCLVQAGRAVISQYQGDQQQLAIQHATAAMRQHYRQLYRTEPVWQACDRHPDYRLTRDVTEDRTVPAALVQHHHAHLASCLGENGVLLDGEAVLGVCLDGTGFGDPDGLWGGEFLYGNYADVVRVGSLRACALPGGDTATREPWRLLVAQLLQAGIDPENVLDIWPMLVSKPLAVVRSMIEHRINTPMSSSAGRLFDAVGAALGCYADSISYEGQAAIALEALAQQCAVPAGIGGYAMDVTKRDGRWQLDPGRIWLQLLDDLRQRRPPEEVAQAFHLGLAQGVVELVTRIQHDYPFETLALSGGVMQNARLVGLLEAHCTGAGLKVLRHRHLPCNDSGLALGQALVTMARLSRARGRQE
ncbi:carbamoyltransferase HypF [Marinobacterium marinum]|uniref:Carbamoyltransferase HypF n=1 Tax=Marinobacterium marinum TaxID=2756129 RepID=A0A7W1WX01_9GAMM|nr:carbamoyltransferase HypF [Marinobacterium marinum]MBA4501790.1 carbamoyltransferase HypF [Marinobacterium marinum]